MKYHGYKEYFQSSREKGQTTYHRTTLRPIAGDLRTVTFAKRQRGTFPNDEMVWLMVDASSGIIWDYTHSLESSKPHIDTGWPKPPEDNFLRLKATSLRLGVGDYTIKCVPPNLLLQSVITLVSSRPQIRFPIVFAPYTHFQVCVWVPQFHCFIRIYSDWAWIHSNGLILT